MAAISLGAPTCLPYTSSGPRVRAALSLHTNPPKINSPSPPKLESNHYLSNNQRQLGEQTLLFPHGKEKEEPVLMARLQAVAEIVADRAEMHANLAEQRNNWNTLLLNSTNSITLAAATMAALASFPSSHLSLTLSSTFLYSAATAMVCLMTKIQPSQLAEEQRKAARLFKSLHSHIHSTLGLHPSSAQSSQFLDDAMAQVLAIDEAYPLPLLPGMLEKFPSEVKPAMWWPKRAATAAPSRTEEDNGWSAEKEREMAEVARVVKERDTAEYVRLSKLVLNCNRVMAVAGPILMGAATVGSALGGSATVVGVVAGALACIVNSFSHGGQVGMVFEMYRNNAGFYRLLDESLSSSLGKPPAEREHADLVETRVALQLGRSISSLRNLPTSSKDPKEFGSRLF
ncbi:LOW QUALITY PROTEIN: probable F-box protein At4g22030 [Amborella trichopoda]|nr:LOW QUALITY PROTEIN: probable F-box protein At4g22030 [Amborella trichopoda]|eukprot:XP_020529939.1 LOW QUALITY PROTEIN: probable F-box protein At4g22030 [Amborella trichopoda]